MTKYVVFRQTVCLILPDFAQIIAYNIENTMTKHQLALCNLKTKAYLECKNKNIHTGVYVKK